MATRLDDLYVLVPARYVDAAVTGLREKLPAEDVEVHRPEAERYRRLDERLRRDVRAVGRGVLLGAVIGAAVAAVVAVLLVVAAVLSPWGAAMVPLAGAIPGALISAVIHLRRTEPQDDDPAVDVVVDDPHAVRIVVVRDPNARDWARDLLEEEFEAVPLEVDEPLSQRPPAAAAPAPETEPAPEAEPPSQAGEGEDGEDAPGRPATG